MKTPMQELIDEMRKSPLMFAPALALIEQMEMLEKEKEVMCEFGRAVLNENINGCGPTCEMVYDETFKPEKQ